MNNKDYEYTKDDLKDTVVSCEACDGCGIVTCECGGDKCVCANNGWYCCPECNDWENLVSDAQKGSK